MYIILKNGEPMSFSPRSIEGAISLIQQLESHMDRLKEHSPYTIGKVE